MRKEMSKDITIKLSKEMEEFLTEKSQEIELPLEETIEQLINEQINSKVMFEEGFYYDKLKNCLLIKMVKQFSSQNFNMVYLTYFYKTKVKL